jgi:hypothetical protein
MVNEQREKARRIIDVGGCDMKNSKLMIAVVSVFLVLLAPVTAQTDVTRVRVPFAFNIGQRALAAGEYRVIFDGTTLRVALMDGQGVICAFNYISTAPNQYVRPQMVFHRYGNRYFLSEVWTGDLNRGYKLVMSRVEREYARAAQQQSTSVLAERFPN